MNSFPKQSFITATTTKTVHNHGGIEKNSTEPGQILRMEFRKQFVRSGSSANSINRKHNNLLERCISSDYDWTTATIRYARDIWKWQKTRLMRKTSGWHLAHITQWNKHKTLQFHYPIIASWSNDAITIWPIYLLILMISLLTRREMSRNFNSITFRENSCSLPTLNFRVEWSWTNRTYQTQDCPPVLAIFDTNTSLHTFSMP